MKASSPARIRTALARAGSAALAAGLLASGGCGEGEPAAKPVPGIVLVCLDTLRADALSAVGGDATRMPALEAFARGGTAFRDASSCASWTAPGVTSILTGLLPSHHGVQGVQDSPPLLASVPTLAEAFHRAGWWTGAAVAGGWVTASHGIARGFDRFSETFDDDGPEAAVSALFSARPKDKPFFAFLHTYAAHDPYGDKKLPSPLPAAVVAEAERVAKRVDENGGSLPHDEVRRLMTAFLTDPPARKAYGDAFATRDWAGIWAPGMRWIDGGFASEPDRREIERGVAAAYWRGVGHCDRVLSLALGALARLALPEGTAIVVTADHGEAFGEHGILGHGRRLDDELVRVPLVVRAPGRIRAGEVARGSVSTLDVAPTCLDLAGIAEPKGLDGRSLLAVLAGKEAGRPVRAEARRDAATALTSIRTERWKGVLARSSSGGPPSSASVFDLRADPKEATPVAGPPDDPAFVRAWEGARGER